MRVALDPPGEPRRVFAFLGPVMMGVLSKSHEDRIADLERMVADLRRVVGMRPCEALVHASTMGDNAVEQASRMSDQSFADALAAIQRRHDVAAELESKRMSGDRSA